MFFHNKNNLSKTTIIAFKKKWENKQGKILEFLLLE